MQLQRCNGVPGERIIEGHSLLWATWATLIARPCKLSELGGSHWPILEMSGPLDCKALQIKGVLQGINKRGDHKQSMRRAATS